MPDVLVNNMRLDLDPRPGEDPPAVPIVVSIDAEVTNDCLVKAIKLVLEMTADKAPLDVEFKDAHFVNGGAEISVSAGVSRFLKASAKADVRISGANNNRVAIEVKDIHAMGKLPVDGIVGPILEKALVKASAMPGIERDPGSEHGLLIDPNALLRAKGVPLEFKEPGVWSVVYGPSSMTAKYTAN